MTTTTTTWTTTTTTSMAKNYDKYSRLNVNQKQSRRRFVIGNVTLSTFSMQPDSFNWFWLQPFGSTRQMAWYLQTIWMLLMILNDIAEHSNRSTDTLIDAVAHTHAHTDTRSVGRSVGSVCIIAASGLHIQCKPCKCIHGMCHATQMKGKRRRGKRENRRNERKAKEMSEKPKKSKHFNVSLKCAWCDFTFTEHFMWICHIFLLDYVRYFS